MPNLASPAKTPRTGRQDKVKLSCTPDKYGVIPFTTLDIPHPFNPDAVLHSDYQGNFLKFSPIPVTRTDELVKTLRDAIRDKDLDRPHLEHLREVYAVVVKGRGRQGSKAEVETGLLTQLCHKIDKTFFVLWSKCVKSGDKDLLRELIEEAEADPLLNHLIKRSTNLEEVKAKFPDVLQAFVAKTRNELDAGGGRRSSSARRPSHAAVMKEVQKDKAEGWRHITFNPETGRLNLTTEIKFAKSNELYNEGLPATAEFEDEDLAQEVLKEILLIYKTFRVKFDVVQVHKSPYKSKEEEGEHEEWLINLAKVRAKKLRNALDGLGIPKDMMSAKVETVDRTVVMQYCTFKMAWQNVNFNSQRMLITSKVEIMWEEKEFTSEHHDEPHAELPELVICKQVCKEVVQIANYYKLEVAIVIHGQERNRAVNDDHRLWLEDLFENRAAKLKEVLADQDYDEAKISTRVIDEAHHDTVNMCRSHCVGCHFELIKDKKDNEQAMGTSKSTANKSSKTEHALYVQGAGNQDYNGMYRPDGNHLGQMIYRQDDGQQTISYGVDKAWYMCINHDTKQSFYKTRDLSGGTVWKHTIPNTVGMLPEVEFLYGDEAKKGPGPRSRFQSTASKRTAGGAAMGAVKSNRSKGTNHAATVTFKQGASFQAAS